MWLSACDAIQEEEQQAGSAAAGGADTDDKAAGAGATGGSSDAAADDATSTTATAGSESHDDINTDVGGDGEGEEGEESASGQRDLGEALDALYFSRYDDPAVHAASVKDRQLVGAFRTAIKAASGQLAGKTVVDVGCGVGHLSVLCAKVRRSCQGGGWGVGGLA